MASVMPDRMNVFSVPLIIVLLCLSSAGFTQSTSNMKPELLVFSGSDWCIPCIKFDREIRRDPEFIEFANKNLIITVADFPQRSRLSKAEEEKNERLAEKYNPNGIFPYALLLDSNGEIIIRIETNKVSPSEVIQQISTSLPKNRLVEKSISQVLMGSGFQITLIADESEIDNLLASCIHEIESVESWLSSWQEESITSKLNNNAAKASIEVSDDYYQLVSRCLQLSSLTQGAFDISFNGYGNLYTFDKKEQTLPSTEEITQLNNNVGFDKIILQPQNRIEFAEEGVRIGFGAIGKGFVADRVRTLMKSKGVSSGVINASGDLTTWGHRLDGSEWNAGIPDPEDRDNIILGIPLSNQAIATSGDYEKYFLNEGVRYSHIINPKTGYPVIGSRSVSVISNSAELSDALATAVAVLGSVVGLDLINQLEGVECIFIDNNRKLHFSNGLKAYEN